MNSVIWPQILTLNKLSSIIVSKINITLRNNQNPSVPFKQFTNTQKEIPSGICVYTHTTHMNMDVCGCISASPKEKVQGTICAVSSLKIRKKKKNPQNWQIHEEE